MTAKPSPRRSIRRGSGAQQLRPKLRHRGPANLLRWILNFRGQRRAIGRGYLFDALGRVTPSVAVDTGGLRLHLNTADHVVSRGIFANGLWERPMFERLTRELAVRGLSTSLDGKVFLDIGANIGTASCHAVTAYGAAESWAFEPAPENVQFLRQNIVANRLEDRVRVHACALSDHDGSVALELSDGNAGDHRVRTVAATSAPSLMGESRWRTTEVAARRLDGFVENGALDLDRVGLAWVDVQGHEGHVLGGALALLNSPVPVVCEFWPYGLRRAGGFERFCEQLTGRRSGFVDLGRQDGTTLPLSALGELADARRPDEATDLLLLPL